MIQLAFSTRRRSDIWRQSAVRVVVQTRAGTTTTPWDLPPPRSGWSAKDCRCRSRRRPGVERRRSSACTRRVRRWRSTARPRAGRWSRWPTTWSEPGHHHGEAAAAGTAARVPTTPAWRRTDDDGRRRRRRRRWQWVYWRMRPARSATGNCRSVPASSRHRPLHCYRALTIQHNTTQRVTLKWPHQARQIILDSCIQRTWIQLPLAPKAGKASGQNYPLAIARPSPWTRDSTLDSDGCQIKWLKLHQVRPLGSQDWSSQMPWTITPALADLLELRAGRFDARRRRDCSLPSRRRHPHHLSKRTVQSASTCSSSDHPAAAAAAAAGDDDEDDDVTGRRQR